MSRNAFASLGRSSFALSAIIPDVFRVSVLDVNGKPWRGIWAGVLLSHDSDSLGADTDGNGLAQISYVSGRPPAAVRIFARLPEGDRIVEMPYRKAVSEVIEFRSTTSQPNPIATPLELAAFASGILIAVLGATLIENKTAGGIVGGIGSTLAASSVVSAIKRRL